MTRTGVRCIFGIILGVAFTLAGLSVPSYGAILYKNYVVRQDQGRDILCDPYVVQKDDYVIKLFKEKGEISEKDFPEFLNIFRRLNPSIRNIDRILPDQHLLIPLRKLQADALPGQATGLVTIPFVTLSGVTELLKNYSNAHVVRSGDSVSELIARRFGDFGSRSYKDGIRLFKLMNPKVTRLNRILLGQRLSLPDPSIRKEPWFSSLFDESGRMADQRAFKDVILSKDATEMSGSPAPVGSVEPSSAMAKAAVFLKTKLISKGRYFFPGKGGKDIELDLARSPVMRFEDGSRIIFPREDPVSDEDLAAIRSYWRHTSTVSVLPGATYEGILDAIAETGVQGSDDNPALRGATVKAEKRPLIRRSHSFVDNGLAVDIHARWILEEPSSDGGLPRRICVMPFEDPDYSLPDPVIRYLAGKNIVVRRSLQEEPDAASLRDTGRDISGAQVSLETTSRRQFVTELLRALRFSYSPNGQITFPYAGLQVKTVSNIILKPDGNPLLVDFGEFYGDAVAALTKAGFGITRIASDDSYAAIVRKLLGVLDVSFSENEAFAAGSTAGGYRILFTIPGFFIPKAQASKVLIANQALPGEIVQFLRDDGITILTIGTN